MTDPLLIIPATNSHYSKYHASAAGKKSGGGSGSFAKASPKSYGGNGGSANSGPATGGRGGDAIINQN